MTTATIIEEFAVVELLSELDGFPRGAVGTIVTAHPDSDLYLVEVTDARGHTVGLVEAHADELRPISL